MGRGRHAGYDEQREAIHALLHSIAEAHVQRLQQLVDAPAGAAQPPEARLRALVQALLHEFTWLQPGGPLDHAAMAPIVADLFLGGLGAVKMNFAGDSP